MRTKHKFTREGRSIHMDGRPLVSIQRDGDTEPVVADALTRSIFAALKSGRLRVPTVRQALR